MKKDDKVGGAKAEKVEADQVLVAVVVTDSFNHRFMPLTLEQPRCLLPLMNVPLIEYTLEFLALSGVQEILLVCCAHSEKIKEYLRTEELSGRGSRWAKSTLPKVSTFVSQELRSVGDALRDLDAKQVLKSDFILVSGDIVSSMNLQDALEAHRSRGEEGIYVLDSSTKQCVQYESVFPRKRRLKIMTELFKNRSNLEIRNDLLDCQIDLCSVDVENFDWQDIRRHFVRGILESDLLGKTIYCHVISTKYAARVRSTQMYDSISKDMISRWTFPVVPDGNITGGLSYTYSSPHIYKEKGVILSRSTTLVRHVVVGSGTEIGSDTSITGSVIGRNCKIGNNVVIDGSYIWENTVIEDNCRISRSILASGVHLRSGVKVGNGSILSYKTVIGSNFSVPPFSRISRLRKAQSDSDEDESDAEVDEADGEFSPNIVGEGGKGYAFVDEMSDDEDGRDIKLEENDDPLDDDSDESGMETDADEDSKWRREVALTIERGIKENLSTDNVIVELNPLKFAHNLSFHDLRKEAIPIFLKLISPSFSAKDVVARWGDVLRKLVFDDDDQVDVLKIVEEDCEESEAHAKVILHILQALYQGDIVEEDAITTWYRTSKGSVRDLSKPFVDWLAQAEEEEDDDDEE
ncbi:hypothetical protein HK405_004814 [Cladochytrium tenue]|nr:hypothetical protein HK405_004814 [Cladochytrium tenue]